MNSSCYYLIDRQRDWGGSQRQTLPTAVILEWNWDTPSSCQLLLTISTDQTRLSFLLDFLFPLLPFLSLSFSLSPTPLYFCPLKRQENCSIVTIVIGDMYDLPLIEAMCHEIEAQIVQFSSHFIQNHTKHDIICYIKKRLVMSTYSDLITS